MGKVISVARLSLCGLEENPLTPAPFAYQKMSFEQLSANAEILVLAGSETTATLLSGCTYLLLTNPEKMEKLKHEVRSAFANDGEITASSVNKLPYMLGVLNEALRLYPPVTSSLVRVVPPGGDMVTEHWVPEGVSRRLDLTAFSSLCCITRMI